jgi:hypothetical protein
MGDCAPPMQCYYGRCLGSPAGGSCELPSNIQTCGTNTVCLNKTCVAAVSAGEQCSPTVPCQQGLFCSSDSATGVCLPNWSLRPGAPCQKMYDQCITTAVCGGADFMSGTCKSLTMYPKAFEKCKGSQDCPTGSVCNCKASGEMMCEYSDAAVFSQVLQEEKRQFLECVIASNCSTDLTSHILTAKE